MPKRKVDNSNPRISPANDRTMWNGSSKRSNVSNSSNNKKGNKSKVLFSRDEAESLWREIADEGTIATMEGISTLCHKLDIDPLEDIRVLILLWKLGATSKPAQITQEEWMNGCEKLGVDRISKFQSLLPSLETGFLDQEEFKDFYKVCICQHQKGSRGKLTE
jgi:hypothetical protein